MSIKSNHFLIISLWFFLVILGVTSRSYFPIDETRYVTVAWNMWLNGDYLVPYLNSMPYSDKPPLLFWLITIGWHAFGVNDWWPRLISPFFSLASVLVTRQIVGLLWPGKTSIKDTSAYILLSCGLWVVYSTALMFDMMMAFFTVLGIWGLLIVHQTRQRSGWLLFTLAIGGGLLAKGPAILLQLLPVALLAPWWAKHEKFTFSQWYRPILISVVIGIIIALCWAIPAAIRGGTHYEDAIFWGQTANRLVHSFAHARPFWWYLSLLPVLLFPWILFGAFWRSLICNRAIWAEVSVRFCLAWLIPVLFAFSIISGKQVHYILPLFPVFAIMMARFIEPLKTFKQSDLALVSLLGIGVSLLLIALPIYAKSHPGLADWIRHIPLWIGALGLIYVATLHLLLGKSKANFISHLSVGSVVFISTLFAGVVYTADNAYDVRPMSYQIKRLQLAHIPVAYLGRYPGIYNFVGRLNQSPDIVNSQTVNAWFAQHPEGKIVVFFKHKKLIRGEQFEFVQDYKGSVIALLNRAQFAVQTNARGQAED